MNHYLPPSALRRVLATVTLCAGLGFCAEIAPAQEIGTDERLSTVGTDADTARGGFDPAVAYSVTSDLYLVVYEADESGNDEFEIYGQFVTMTPGGPVPGTPFAVSAVGGGSTLQARDPAVEWDSFNNRFLVVWSADESTDGEFEIWGQRYNAATGAPLGSNFKISTMAGDGDPDYAALAPDLVFNLVTRQYLVVWYGDDDTAPLVDGDMEIFGRRVGTGGGLQGSQIRISDMDGDGATGRIARRPAVTWNATDNLFLVVWEGEESGVAQEIYGQLLASNGAETGTNDFRISNLGSADADATWNAHAPDAAWNEVTNRFVVVWRGDRDSDGGDNATEIFAQQLVGATAAETGTTDQLLSAMGIDPASAAFQAFDPAIVCDNGSPNRCMIVWTGDDDTDGLGDGEFEVYGVVADGSTLTDAGLGGRLSDMGGTGNTTYRAEKVAIAGNTDGEALIVWQGDDDTLTDNEFEIWGQGFMIASGAAPTPTPTATASPNPTASPTAVPCCLGDANNSGSFVDANDFITVQANFGADNGLGGLGDANCSGGFVDANDFITVQARFGADCS